LLIIQIKVKEADISVFTTRKKIGAGESEAFALAIELKADAVLTDDYGAVIEAKRNNIPTFTIPLGRSLRQRRRS
jgi:predicted nucleic acid-binding protein